MPERKNSEARIRANNKYAAKAYDRINIAVPKGRKDGIQAHAAEHGESINAFIGRAIEETMVRDGNIYLALGLSAVEEDTPLTPGLIEALNSLLTSTETAQGSGAVSFPPDVLEAAQRAADAEGESVGDFLRRAVETQAQRDKIARGLKR